MFIAYDSLRPKNKAGRNLTERDVQNAQKTFSTIAHGCLMPFSYISATLNIQRDRSEAAAFYHVTIVDFKTAKNLELREELLGREMLKQHPLRGLKVDKNVMVSTLTHAVHSDPTPSAHEIAERLNAAIQLLGRDHPLIHYARENISLT